MPSAYDDVPAPEEGPAVFVLDDGRIVEFPEMTCGQAYEMWLMARELAVPIGGDEIDPESVRVIGVMDE